MPILAAQAGHIGLDWHVTKSVLAERAALGEAEVVLSTRKPEDLAMERYADGDLQALGVVYDAIAPRLYSFLVKRIRQQDVAEDIVQQTFLQMHRARGTFTVGSEVAPWAFSIARRLMIDWTRQAKRRHGVVEAGEFDLQDERAGVLDVLVMRELGEDVFRRLSDLPSNQREAFELIRLDGLSTREAAGILGTTVSAVKLRAHRAYVALGLDRAHAADEGDE